MKVNGTEANPKLMRTAAYAVFATAGCAALSMAAIVGILAVVAARHWL